MTAPSVAEGEWFDFFSGRRYGGGWDRYGGLADTPVFAKAGAIVPLAPRVGWGGVGNPKALSSTSSRERTP